MKKIILTTSLIVISSLMVGCYAGVGTMNEVPGSIYADYKIGDEASGNVTGKKGKACAQSILGLVGLGNASISRAAKAGGISNVTSVTRRVKNIIGVYAEYCIEVTGS